MKRIKLRDRLLPDYTKGEEIMNMVTHIVGGALGIIALALCLLRTVPTENVLAIFSSLIYGLSMICLYCFSSIYHGLRPCLGKLVLQVVDHCTIYFLIAGTYTPIVLCAIEPVYPGLGWGLFAWQWSLGILAAVLTAIDLKKYSIFSMICYIGMGWGIIFFIPIAVALLTPAGFGFLLAGGIVYTIGAVLYGIGSRKPWMHSIFHIFVVLGSLLQLISIYFYVL